MVMTENENSSHILVVDDDAAVCQFLTRIWRSEGFQVTSAFNGADALSIIQESLAGQQPPLDLVLLDILMPGMDGIETCRRIRMELGLTSLPIIMLTALNEFQSRIDALEVGANDYLTKPFTIRELQARAKNLLRLGQEVRQRIAAEAERKRAEELSTIHQTTLALAQSLELNVVLRVALEKTMSIIETDTTGYILLQDPQDQTLRMAAHRGTDSDPACLDNPKLLDECGCGRAAATGEIQVSLSSDAKHHPQPCNNHNGNHLALPLKSQDQLVGVLCVCQRDDLPLTESQIQVLEIIGQHVGAAVLNAQLFAKTKQALDELRMTMD